MWRHAVSKIHSSVREAVRLEGAEQAIAEIACQIQQMRIIRDGCDAHEVVSCVVRLEDRRVVHQQQMS